MREIKPEEVYKLKDCILGLAEYHNEVSVLFKGTYPRRPCEETLNLFEEALSEGSSHIAVIEKDDAFVGFCKIDIHGTDGKLDYLFVNEENRRKGCGGLLMDWAVTQFKRYGVRHIEVKVVDGNPALYLYEKYGFRMNAHILVNNLC